MNEEIKVDNMPAGAGTQEAPNQTTTETKVETKTEPTFREKMFGDKIKPKEEPKNDEQKDKPDAVDENKTDAADAKKEEPKKKGAKDRIQELAREKNSYKEQVSLKDQEIERLSKELQNLQAKKENRTVKDDYREVFIEEKLKENMRAIQTELQEYSSNHENPEMFETNYNYYMPAFNQHDPWTIQQISKFPEKIAMFDKFFEAMTNGVFTPQEWINAPQPLKMQKINELRKLLNAPKETQQVQTPKPAIPDSIVPNLNPKHEPMNPNNNKGVAFRKAFERGRK
jgi:hypothetical protein